jgi:hypothetical protein
MARNDEFKIASDDSDDDSSLLANLRFVEGVNPWPETGSVPTPPEWPSTAQTVTAEAVNLPEHLGIASDSDEWIADRIFPDEARFSPESIAWYGSFRFFERWGVYIRVDKLTEVAARVFNSRYGSSADICDTEKLRFIFLWLLNHERFHFLTDCMVGQMELLFRASLYRTKTFPLHMEEKMAEAYALRALSKQFDSDLVNSLATFITRTGSEGYRDGPMAVKNGQFKSGLIDLSLFYAPEIPEKVGTKWGRRAVDWAALYPNRQKVLSQVPVYLVRERGLSSQSIQLIQSINDIQVSQRFEKSLRKLSPHVRSLWEECRLKLNRGTYNFARDFQKWKGDEFSVRVGGNSGPAYRAHLRMRKNQPWEALDIGTHKGMGHG